MHHKTLAQGPPFPPPLLRAGSEQLTVGGAASAGRGVGGGVGVDAEALGL